MEIKFISDEQKTFYEEILNRSRKVDVYHRAFFYLIGLTHDTRQHVSSLFDFVGDVIIPEGLDAGWQTGSTTRICRLAFNLWNGYDGEGTNGYTPDELFCCEFAEYFCEAIKLRFPESFHIGG